MLELDEPQALDNEETTELGKEWTIFESKTAKKRWKHANTVEVNKRKAPEPRVKNAILKVEAEKKENLSGKKLLKPR